MLLYNIDSLPFPSSSHNTNICAHILSASCSRFYLKICRLWDENGWLESATADQQPLPIWLRNGTFPEAARLVWVTWPSFLSMLNVWPARCSVLCLQRYFMLESNGTLGTWKSLKSWTNWISQMPNIIWTDAEISLWLYRQPGTEVKYILA